MKRRMMPAGRGIRWSAISAALLAAALLAAPAWAQPITQGVGGGPAVTVSATGGFVSATGVVQGPITFPAGLGTPNVITGATDQAIQITANNGGSLGSVNLGAGNATLAITSVGDSVTVGNTAIGLLIGSVTIEQVVAGGIRFQSVAQPTVSTCGTGSVTTGSTDNAGEVTATGATTCTVNFTTTPFSTAAFCTVTDETTAAALRISAISTTAFTVTNLTAGDKFLFTCFGK